MGAHAWAATLSAPRLVLTTGLTARSSARSIVPRRSARCSATPPPAEGGGSAPTAEGGGSSNQSSSGGSSSGGAMPSNGTVAIEYRGRTVQAQQASTLRTAMLQAGVTPHNGRATLINCRGLGTCGTCAVEVQGPVEPQQWTTQERLRLAFPPHAPPGNRRLRLACQVACQGDLRVIKRDGFWGQGDQVLPDLPAAAASGSSSAADVAPLGQLEFVLDRRRRGQPGQRSP